MKLKSYIKILVILACILFTDANCYNLSKNYKTISQSLQSSNEISKNDFRSNTVFLEKDMNSLADKLERKKGKRSTTSNLNDEKMTIYNLWRKQNTKKEICTYGEEYKTFFQACLQLDIFKGKTEDKATKDLIINFIKHICDLKITKTKEIYAIGSVWIYLRKEEKEEICFSTNSKFLKKFAGKGTALNAVFGDYDIKKDNESKALKFLLIEEYVQSVECENLKKENLKGNKASTAVVKQAKDNLNSLKNKNEEKNNINKVQQWAEDFELGIESEINTFVIGRVIDKEEYDLIEKQNKIEKDHKKIKNIAIVEGKYYIHYYNKYEMDEEVDINCEETKKIHKVDENYELRNCLKPYSRLKIGFKDENEYSLGFDYTYFPKTMYRNYELRSIGGLSYQHATHAVKDLRQWLERIYFNFNKTSLDFLKTNGIFIIDKLYEDFNPVLAVKDQKNPKIIFYLHIDHK